MQECSLQFTSPSFLHCGCFLHCSCVQDLTECRNSVTTISWVDEKCTFARVFCSFVTFPLRGSSANHVRGEVRTKLHTNCQKHGWPQNNVSWCLVRKCNRSELQSKSRVTIFLRRFKHETSELIHLPWNHQLSQLLADGSNCTIRPGFAFCGLSFCEIEPVICSNGEIFVEIPSKSGYWLICSSISLGTWCQKSRWGTLFTFSKWRWRCTEALF